MPPVLECPSCDLGVYCYEHQDGPQKDAKPKVKVVTPKMHKEILTRSGPAPCTDKEASKEERLKVDVMLPTIQLNGRSLEETKIASPTIPKRQSKKHRDWLKELDWISAEAAQDLIFGREEGRRR